MFFLTLSNWCANLTSMLFWSRPSSGVMNYASFCLTLFVGNETQGIFIPRANLHSLCNCYPLLSPWWAFQHCSYSLHIWWICQVGIHSSSKGVLPTYRNNTTRTRRVFRQCCAGNCRQRPYQLRCQRFCKLAYQNCSRLDCHFGHSQ